MIQLIVSGCLHGEAGKGIFSAKAGDICVFDLARPLRSMTSGGRTLSLLVDRSHLERSVRFRSLHCHTLSGKAPATRLFRDLFHGLCREVPLLSADHAEAVESATFEWLGAALVNSAEAPQLTSPVLGSVLYCRVMDYIDRHLDDPALSAGMLCARFNVSRAHLYRAFAEHGGIAAIIRQRRLDRAHAMLQNPHYRLLSIAAIAACCGFRSSSRFHTAFRQRFETAPSTVRRQTPIVPRLGEGLQGLTSAFVKRASEYGMLVSGPGPTTVG